MSVGRFCDLNCCKPAKKAKRVTKCALTFQMSTKQGNQSVSELLARTLLHALQKRHQSRSFLLEDLGGDTWSVWCKGNDKTSIEFLTDSVKPIKVRVDNVYQFDIPRSTRCAHFVLKMFLESENNFSVLKLIIEKSVDFGATRANSKEDTENEQESEDEEEPEEKKQEPKKKKEKEARRSSKRKAVAESFEDEDMPALMKKMLTRMNEQTKLLNQQNANLNAQTKILNVHREILESDNTLERLNEFEQALKRHAAEMYNAQKRRGDSID